MKIACFLFASLLLISPLIAQEEQDKPTTLQLPNSPVTEVLDNYQKLTGKRLIKDVNLAGGNNLSIVVNTEIPTSEAIRLIEAALLLNGYALIPGPDNTVKVVNTMGGKNPRSEGVPLFASAASLPKGEQVVSYFMALRYLSAQEAAQIFSQHIVVHSPYGVIVAVPNAQALVFTENVSVIQQAIALQELIDVPPAKISTEFVSLERADAERVAETITKLLDARKSNAPAAPGGAPAPTQNVAVNERGIAGIAAGDAQLIADARTNRILVVTRPAIMDYLKNLIREFDQAANVVQPLEFPLNYAKAEEVLDTLVNILQETQTGAPGAAGGAANQNQNRPTSGAQRPGASTSNNANNRGAAGTDVGGLTEPADDTAPISAVVGKTKLIADRKANSILVLGPPESKERVTSILERLDRKPLQVHLATVIGNLTLGDGSEFGVDILRKFTKIRGGGLAGGLLNRDDSVPDPASLISSNLFPAISGLTLYGAIGNQLNAYVKALESSTRFKILSRPSIYTENNKLAIIVSGRQVPVPANSLSSLNSGSTNNASVTTSLDYKDVVLRLEVIPQINADKEINLKISQTNDSIESTTTIAGNSVPIVATQSLKTTITVKDQETVVLGGLVTDEKRQTVTGLPWLSRIPLLGMLFKDTQKSNNRTELIILIQPTVIANLEEERVLKAKETGRVVVGPDAEKYAKPPERPPKDQTQRPFFLPRNDKVVP